MYGFTEALGLVLNCLFDLLTVSNLLGIKRGKTSKDMAHKATYLTAC